MEDADQTAEDEGGLRSLYEKAQGFVREFEESADQERLEKALILFRKCQLHVQKLSLFSENESLEDLSSVSLRFMLVDYEIGSLMLRQSASLNTRLPKVEEAILALEGFLHRVEAYGLLDANERKLFERIRSAEARGRKGSPEVTRAEKIGRFKKEKQLKQAVAELSQRNGDTTEDIVRELALQSISLAVLQCLDTLVSAYMELDMLKQMPREAGETDVSRKADENHEARLETGAGLNDRSKPLLDQKGKPLQPFMITNQRQRLRNQVFGPGYNLPTMSVDEYLEEEARRGGVIDNSGNDHNNSNGLNEDGEDDEEESDRKTYEARAWDEYVEANPRGSGNRMVNRG